MPEREWINWTPDMRDRFQKVYDEAVAKNMEQFTFEGHAFVTTYAGYLLEYLATRFPKGGHQ